MISYTMEFVGTTELDNIQDAKKFVAFVRKGMTGIGVSAVRNINNQIAQKEWKRRPRTLGRAIRYEVDDWGVTIYSDNAIAPHAIYQEEGVERHEMRYLLHATSSIPLKIGKAQIFRWATEKWMGVPHPFVDPKSGMVMQASGWIHPGYRGKYYFRDGISDTIAEFTERFRGLVIRVARGE